MKLSATLQRVTFILWLLGLVLAIGTICRIAVTDLQGTAAQGTIVNSFIGNRNGSRTTYSDVHNDISVDGKIYTLTGENFQIQTPGKQIAMKVDTSVGTALYADDVFGLFIPGTLLAYFYVVVSLFFGIFWGISRSKGQSQPVRHAASRIVGWMEKIYLPKPSK